MEEKDANCIEKTQIDLKLCFFDKSDGGRSRENER